MDSKLRLLIDSLKLNNYDSYFTDGRLISIIGNSTHSKYIFNIELKSNLPINIYDELYSNLVSYYKDLHISLNVSVSDINTKYINEYFEYFINRYSKKCPMLSMFLDDKLDVSVNLIKIFVSSKAELDKFESIKDKLISNFKSAGYDINISAVIDEELSKEISREITNSIEANSYVSKERMDKKDEVIEEVNTYKKKYTPKPIETVDDERAILGRIIDTTPVRLDTLNGVQNNVTVEANIFGIDVRETRTDLRIVTLKITDYTDSMYAKIFIHGEEETNRVTKLLKTGKFYKFRGNIKDDKYSGEDSLVINDINTSDRVIETRIDDAPIKRVELHAHTMMSQMDGVVDAVKLCKTARAWGHKAIAITDHNGVQAYPGVYHYVCDVNKNLKEGEVPFKAIYGTELTMIDDSVKIVLRPNDSKLLDNTYVIFDLETTGFNAGGADSIIEIGAVKLSHGNIIEKYDELINPGRSLPNRITELTGITDKMLEGKCNEEEAVKKFMEWVGDYPMVAHNAKFDTSFMEMAYKKYNLGVFSNTVIDTLELSRTMDTGYARHSLSMLVKRYNVEFDEDSHHRGDYDAEATGLVFHKMLQKLDSLNFEKISDLDRLVEKDEIYKYGRAHHVNILVKNKVGLKNLFRIVSLANTTYLHKTPRILRSKLDELREGLLIGSGCYEGEVFVEARSKSEEEITNIINFYDYIEVQPPEVYDHLLQTGDFDSKSELLEHIRKIVKLSEAAGKIVVATGDVHQLNREDKIYREVIVNQKVPGGGRHPLAKRDIKSIPSQHFRTTREMLENFEFLGDDKAYELVVTNTNKIADMIDIIEVIIETGGVPFSPKIDKSVETVTTLVYTKASSWYGDPLPINIEERIAKELYGDAVLNSIKEILDEEGNLSGDDYEKEAFRRLHAVILEGFDSVKALVRQNVEKHNQLEGDELEKKVKKTLGGIIGGGFDVIYLIAQKLVKHSNDEGYLVGSRGSVGSSFVATMMGITEVNPLPAHYRCLKCKYSIFTDDSGEALGKEYSSGFDLPDKVCPNCKEALYKDGQDMPFATFLGFNADKVPDIDLNFSDLNQASAHEYTKVLFGVDNVYRAGTIGTVAEKTAFGFVKGYCEDKNILMNTAEVERIAAGCTGVKRTTGQHPGGIVVIPGYMDVFDFTPFQYPADDINSAWRTTHFDYHAIDQDVLKLDILGHSDPTQLRMLQDLSGMDVTTVPLDDKETMDIFLSPKPLGVTKEQIMNETGTLGIPEFGTPFTIGMLVDTKPTTFSELIKISGLSHGTDVWLGNAQELIRNKVVPFKEVIGCRDDIMVYLMYHGVEPIKAFKIMEFVRKGRASKDPETWKQHVALMQKAGIDAWFIDSCGKIKYMFPKAHAAAYVISAFRIAWFKVHMPALYYATYFSARITDYDIEVMIKGYSVIKARMEEIVNKGYEATNKESSILETLKLALEATARGIKFLPIDLNESEATTFRVKSDTEIYPPFSSIDGLGDTVAKNIVEERKKKDYLSIEEVQKRAKVSATLIDKMRSMGIFDGMEESNQLSLF